MKRLIFMMSLIVGLTTQISAQSLPCDITSSGVQLRSALGAPLSNLFATGAPGIVNFVLSNQGVGQSNGDPCAYAVGKVKVTVSFPTAAYVSYYFRYAGSSNTFSTPKYDWSFDPSNGKLSGVNTAPISTGFSGAEIVDIPVTGVAAGSSILPVSMQIVNSASGDNTNNNAFDLPITVLAGSGGVLPVKLESIDGLSDKCNAQVKWSTSNETNLSKFEIEVSKNGVDFDRAGTIKPSSANAGNYQFNTTQSSGKNYYRLKIIDQNGSFTYSKLIQISTSCSDKIVKVFPNPVKLDQLLNVNISGYDASVKGDLYSSTGQFVKSYVLKNGANNLPVDNLAQGFYSLRVSENGSVTETFKISVLK
jgi:hypothetical protein